MITLGLFLLTLTTSLPFPAAPDTTALRVVYDAEGHATDKIWLLVNRGGFRFRAGSSRGDRLDVNREDEVTVGYREGTQKRSLRLSVRVTFDNSPPMLGDLKKEHSVTGLTLWCVLYDEEEEVLTEELTTEDFVLTRDRGCAPPFPSLRYRGLVLTPGMEFTPLRDYAAGDYAFDFTGLSFAISPAD
jgi:hypothetical protein